MATEALASSVHAPEDPEVVTELAAHMNRLRGRLLGMIEAVGFPPRQETAIKALLKSLTYDAQAELSDVLLEHEHEATATRAEVSALSAEALTAWQRRDDHRLVGLLESLIGPENSSGSPR